MVIKITIVEIIFSLVVCYCCAAQNHEIKFNLVKGNNGKPLGKINSITQDAYGYMWFSGQHDNCIYRYDGSKMISFRHDSLNKNSIGLTVLKKSMRMIREKSGLEVTAWKNLILQPVSSSITGTIKQIVAPWWIMTLRQY
jgi:ligand-binding sensor domain-containing protein